VTGGTQTIDCYKLHPGVRVGNDQVHTAAGQSIGDQLPALQTVIGVSFRSEDQRCKGQPAGQTGGNFGIKQIPMNNVGLESTQKLRQTRDDHHIELPFLCDDVQAALAIFHPVSQRYVA